MRDKSHSRSRRCALCIRCCHIQVRKCACAGFFLLNFECVLFSISAFHRDQSRSHGQHQCSAGWWPKSCVCDSPLCPKQLLRIKVVVGVSVCRLCCGCCCGGCGCCVVVCCGCCCDLLFMLLLLVWLFVVCCVLFVVVAKLKKNFACGATANVGFTLLGRGGAKNDHP